jgi:hypothetical protein
MKITINTRHIKLHVMYANKYIIQLVMLQPDYNTSWERMTSNKIK